MEEAPKKKSKKKAVSSKAKPAKKTKKDRRKGKKVVEETDSESASESEAAGSESEDDEEPSDSATELKRKQLELQLAKLNRVGEKSKSKGQRPKRKSSKRKSSKSKFTAEYKRVDQLWDSTIHNFKLKESAEDDDSEFAEYAFLVRRTFDWENKYKNTVIDVKSKQLRAALVEVMKDCKSVSLEAEEPVIDPNILFLYLEELRSYCKSLKSKIKTEKKRKVSKNLTQQRSLLRSLVDYIDEDYADTKKTLYPLLKNGNITFDLLWALFHPNEVAVTSCYGSWDEPRCFKVEYTNKCASMTRGEWYCIEGSTLSTMGSLSALATSRLMSRSSRGRGRSQAWQLIHSSITPTRRR